MQTRTELPVASERDRLIEALRKWPRLILTAPTGSGKSTLLPQYLADHVVSSPSQVVVVEPRRIAARMLARWVADQRGCQLGDEVGYQVRFENVTGPRTRLRWVTEGLLLRQLLQEPTLGGVGAVVLDEFHERHLEGDLLLALLRGLQDSKRPDLRLLVMSATLQTDSLRNYLQPCEVVSVSGRQFPVHIKYLPKPLRDEPMWDVVALLLDQSFEGDALVFMPGAYEIQRTVRTIREKHGSRFIVLPLHGDLPLRDQDAALARYERPKVVVATNVAETSITIDGIRLVIDSGLARVARFDPRRGFNMLCIENISRTAAEQRAGRAGRTAPGQCWRLWTEREQMQRALQETPEIHRVDLAETILLLRALGVRDLHEFPWFEPPMPAAVARAEQLLRDLGALDTQGELTATGRAMLVYPVHPRHARMLHEAARQNCVGPVALIAALTQGRDLWVRKPGRSAESARAEHFGDEHASDFYRLMAAYRHAERLGFDPVRCELVGVNANAARQVRQIADQFVRLVADSAPNSRGAGTASAEQDAGIRRCILSGFMDQLARRLDQGTRRCQLIHSRRGVLAEDSTVTAPLIVAAEVAEVEGRELTVTLRWATAVEEAWLREMFPGDWREERQYVFDSATRRVLVEHRRVFRDLVLHAVQREAEPCDEVARLLAAHCELPGWNESVEEWIARVNAVAKWLPELGLPRIGDDEKRLLKEEICRGAVSFKEIKDRPVLPVVKRWLSPQQQAEVERHAPERLTLPSGRRAKVQYTGSLVPRISARIQDLYGLEDELRIAGGRVVVAVEVLAPNHRPVQVTRNLSNFWRDQYPQLKQQLQRQYPKHEWR